MSLFPQAPQWTAIAAGTLALGLALVGCASPEAGVEVTNNSALANAPVASAAAIPAPDSVTPSATISPKPTKVLYLTFDDGPAKPFTDQLLKILAKDNAKATFFVNGNMAELNPEQAKNIATAGHAIGNHTYNHPQLTTLSDSEIRKQIKSTAKVIGPTMGPCLRPPYLATNDRVRQIAKGLGYSIVLGDLAGQDWTQPSVPTLVDSLRGMTKHKNNIILHDGPQDRKNTIAAVRKMVPEWTKDGWTLAALPQCVAKSDAHTS